MTKKNSLFTFITACVPGVGYMYYGLMKKGFETALLFFLILQLSTSYYFLGNIFLAILIPIWFFTFFDTYRIANKYSNGEQLEDKCLIINNPNLIKNFINQNSNKKVLGYSLMFIGLFTLLDSISMRAYIPSNFVRETLNLIKIILIPIVIIILGGFLAKNNSKNKEIKNVILEEE